MKRKLWWRLAGIGVLTLALLANIIPWRRLDDGLQLSDLLDTLRPGIDLAGGTRLIYQVNTESWRGGGGETPAQSMIRALKRRVDPTGSMNLVWRPVGEDRIEIIIPRATASSNKQREAYQQARATLLAADVRPSDVERAKSAPTPAARRQAFLTLVRGVQSRAPLLEKLADAYERLLAAGNAPATQPAATEVSATTRPAASTQQAIDTAVLDARSRFEATVKEVMQTNLKWLDVYHVLRMGSKLRDALSDPKDPESATPLKSLKARYPHRVDRIEPVVAAFDAWKKEKAALDDPNDLKRLLKGTGVLEFHIAVSRADVANPESYVQGLEGGLAVPGGRFRWFEAGDPAMARRGNLIGGHRFGTPYVLVYVTPEKSMVHTDEHDWKFKSAYPTRDNWGSPAVGFEFDEIGGQKFAVLTGKNKTKELAAILDGRIISIATIRDKISSSGIITGSFSPEEVAELSQKLQAGALPGSLSKDPISESKIGPQLGEAHRKAGFRAAMIAVIGVVAFMLAYYLIPLGFVANVAVILDLIYILGIMSKGLVLPTEGFTFTLPGIAGLTLAIGMAVDANVLIYERIREEQEAGSPLRTAVKNGYGKALSAILDSNVTTLITTVILYFVGTAEIKGFAIVLGIGVVASMFTAVVVTRVLLQLGVEYGLIKGRMKMLRLIRVPRIRWMDKRYIFWGCSAVLLVVGLFVFFSSPSRELYDVEFLGGTKVQVTLAAGRQATDGQVEALFRDSEALPDASVHTVLEQGSAGTGRKTFEIMTNNPDQNAVKQAVVETLRKPNDREGLGYQSLLPRRSILKFARQAEWEKATGGSSIERLPGDVFAITSQYMPDQGVGGVDLSDYVGGVGALISELQPACPVDDLRIRLRAKLTGGQFDDLPPTGWDVFGIERGEGASDGRPLYRKILYVANSDQFIYDAMPTADNFGWLNSFALPELRMVHQAVSQADVLDSVNNFSPSVARDVKIQALVAIILSLVAVVIYVWVRFGNMLFGLGAIMPLFHDVCVVVGLVAISRFVAATPVGEALMIQNFRFDLTMVAAILTIIGYSLNDTIVVFDRIRENRGRLQYVTEKILDSSINQTMSRTLLTVLTTMVAVLIMYIFGGQGIHGFCFGMLVGLVVGTYSSIAVASPCLLAYRLRGRGAGGRSGTARSK